MSEKVSWSRVPLIRNTSAASATREGRRREREGRRVQRRERRGGEEEERREERGKICKYSTCATQLGFSHAQYICLPLTDERVQLGGGSIGLGQCAVTDQLRLDK